MTAPQATSPATHPAHAERLRYEPALDGLRGVAVLAVMGYHAAVQRLNGGFLGVDVFFVLSGYLITALLLAEHRDRGRIDTGAFWARRARRLLPALVLLLLGVAAYAELVAFAGDRGHLRADAIATALYVQNWHLAWSGASYFASFDPPSPLRHVWSLAIEEQFYLVWPLALIGLLRVARSRRWVLGSAITMGALGSALLMALKYHAGHDPSRVYYGTDTRAQELLVGALLAVGLSRPWRRFGAAITRALPVLGLVAFAVLLWLITHVADTSTWLYRGGFLAISATTAVVIASVTLARTGWLARALVNRPLRATGRISYGLYLFHWPVFLWLDPDRTGWRGAPLLVLRIAVTYAVAIASFVFVEQPARRASKPMWRGRRLQVTAVGAVIVLLAAFMVTTVSATPARVPVVLTGATASTQPLVGPTAPTTTPAQRRTAAALYELADKGPRPDLTPGFDGQPLDNAPIFAPGLDAHDGRPHILMIGDSVLYTLTRNWDPGPQSRADYYNLAQLGCSFVPGEMVAPGISGLSPFACAIENTRWKLLVDRRRPDLSFLLVGAWEVIDHVVDGHRYVVGTPAYAALLRKSLLDEVDLFSSRGGLVALPTVPCFHRPDYDVAGVVSDSATRNDPKRIAAVNAVIREVARERPKVVRIVDLGGFLCPDGHPRDHIDGVEMRRDGVHFTSGGATIAAAWLWPRLEALIPPGPVFATEPGSVRNTRSTTP